MTLDNIIEEIDKAKSIVILTHEMPDGDAIGSSLAMYQGLKQLGKDVDVIIPKYSKTFEFLPYANEIKKEGRMENYDLAIALDCGDIKRLNGFVNYFEYANCKIAIECIRAELEKKQHINAKRFIVQGKKNVETKFKAGKH